MQYEEDFVDEELIEFEIEGKKFGYKPATAGDELDWTDECMEIVDGKAKQNLKKATLCKIRNLKLVPYNQEIIKKMIGVDKEWKDLDNAGKTKLIDKLKPSMLTNIMQQINKIDVADEEVKKN